MRSILINSIGNTLSEFVEFIVHCCKHLLCALSSSSLYSSRVTCVFFFFFAARNLFQEPKLVISDNLPNGGMQFSLITLHPYQINAVQSNSNVF